MIFSRRLTFAFACSLLAGTLPGFSQAQDLSLPSITVTGEASLSVAPDRAIVSAGVSSQAKAAREAMSANNKAMAAVLASLKEQGVADADVQTARLSLEAIRSKDNAQPVAGFQASNRVTVQIREIAKLGEVLDRLVTAGANSIGGIEFIVSNAERLLDKVRADAVADAKRKAEIYVQAAGVGLGRPVTISEQGAPMRPMMRMAAPSAGAAMPVAPGEERISMTVAISYELMR